MIRVAIVEDDENYRQELVSFLHRYEQESPEHFLISEFADGDEIIEKYTASYDMILMDIQMQFMDGMTAAERIREMDNEVIIIFITNVPQYVMRGYTVDALDYVLKPISYFAFTQRINRALQRMQKRKPRYYAVQVKNGIHKLDISQITYIEVLNHDLVYHLTTGDISARGVLGEVEEALQDASFFRCNKSFLVNLEHVDSVTGTDVSVAGQTIQVSRARKKLLMDALNNYINEVSK